MYGMASSRYASNKPGALAIPLHPALAAVLEATDGEHLTFLVTRDGKPFTPPGFTYWFRDMCKLAGLPRVCLRTDCVRLRAGASLRRDTPRI